MRTVSFLDKNVQATLAKDFIATYTNTKGDPTAGHSFSHSPNDAPGPCGKAAGRQNVQCIFTTRAGEIFHVAGGFLSGDDLLKELAFAKELFSEISESNNPKQTVTDSHLKFLTKNGFTKDQIRSGQVGMFNEGMPNFSPKDLGIKLPGGVPSQMFDQMGRYRTLADHRYVATNPLITKAEFEKAPEKLVGKQKSFFGSNAAMNAATGDLFKNGGNLQNNKSIKADKNGQRVIQFDFNNRLRDRDR